MIGIVAEYNPFHEGHKYHIQKSTDGCVVSVMSGDFVQRGEAAIFDKYSRAAQACRNGANLVVELPLPWCVSSSESFAKAGVYLLEKIGVDKISFGSECGNISMLKDLSKQCVEKNDEIIQFMKQNPEYSYPVARNKVINSCLLDKPNNSLGIEYLKFATVECITIKRETIHDGYGSAKDIRSEMKSLGIGVDYKSLETAYISRLISFDKDYFNTLPDSDNGIGNRLYNAVRKGKTLSEICEIAKTKSVTMSAIRRLILCAVLGIDKSFIGKMPPYIRVLAFDSIGKDVLKKHFDIPVLTNGSDIMKLDEFSNKVFALGASANDLYCMCNRNDNLYSCGNDYRKTPIIV